MAAASFSLRSRILLIVAVGITVAVIYGVSAGRSASPQTRAGKLRDAQATWYDKAAARFSEFEYLPLGSQDAAEAAVRRIVEQRCQGDEVAISALVRDAARVMFALSASTLDEYLRRNPLRRLDAGRQLDAQAHSWWEACFGELPPASVGPQEAFEKFAGHTPQARKPAEIAAIGWLQVKLGSSESAERAHPPRFDCVPPDELLAAAMGCPGAAGEPQLTVPKTSLETAAKQQDRVAFCFMNVVLRGTDQRPYMLNLLLYYVKVDDAWHVAGISDSSTVPPNCLPY